MTVSRRSAALSCCRRVDLGTWKCTCITTVANPDVNVGASPSPTRSPRIARHQAISSPYTASAWHRPLWQSHRPAAVSSTAPLTQRYQQRFFCPFSYGRCVPFGGRRYFDASSAVEASLVCCGGVKNNWRDSTPTTARQTQLPASKWAARFDR